MQLTIEVLPAPLGPMIENSSPSRTEKLTSVSARTPPKRSEIPRTSNVVFNHSSWIRRFSRSLPVFGIGFCSAKARSYIDPPGVTMRRMGFAATGTPDAMRDRAASDILPAIFACGAQRGQIPRKAEPKVIVAVQYTDFKAEAWSIGS